MKKYFIVIFLVVVLLISGAYLSLIRKQVSYHKTLSAGAGGVLILDNFDQSRVRIVTNNRDKIEVNLQGSDDELSGVVLNEDGIFTRFGISPEFSSLSGTISVPAGTLIDLTLSDENQVNVQESGSSSEFSDNSFLVDTSNLSSLEFGGNGSIDLSSWGDLIVWDDENWDLIDDQPSNTEDSPDGPPYCGIGSQAIRNYCCVLQNADTSVPECNGVGYYFFDNVERDCAFQCDITEEEPEEEPEEPVDCGIGGQDQRNACCAGQHVGEYQGCLGSWRYNNAASDCEFQCDVFDPLDPPAGDDPVSFDDPISTFCYTIQDHDDRNLCCNDSLKTPLSSGPHPGFPDCIGTWFFDDETGCEFQCADYVEMIQILNEIRQNSQQNQ